MNRYGLKIISLGFFLMDFLVKVFGFFVADGLLLTAGLIFIMLDAITNVKE